MTTMTTGSLMNNLMGNSKQPVPEVGMGATELCWTDRHAYTIVAVVSEKEIQVQRDKATRTDSHGMSDCQSYSYEPDPSATVETLVLKKTKNFPEGKWVRKGSSIKSTAFGLGYRREYYDFSF